MIFNICILLVLYYLYRLWRVKSRKLFTVQQKTNIMITGGLSGLGKLLADRFAQNFNKGEINLIVISRTDENLAALKLSLLEQY